MVPVSKVSPDCCCGWVDTRRGCVNAVSVVSAFMAIDQWWWPLQLFQCEWWGFSRSPPPRLHAGDYADMCTADHTHFDACDDKLIRMRTRVRSCNLIFVSLSIFHRLHGFVSYVWASQWISVCSPYTHGDQGVVAGWVPVVSLQLILEIAFITHSLSPLSHIQRVALHVTSSVSEIHNFSLPMVKDFVLVPL